MKSTNISIRKSIAFFILGALIFITLGGKDTNFWGLTNFSGKKILEKVAKGEINVMAIKLSEKQYDEIRNVIYADTSKYSKLQKYLILEKTGEQILVEVGLGYKTAEGIKLTPNQYEEIKKSILLEPQKYNDAQKALIK